MSVASQITTIMESIPRVFNDPLVDDKKRLEREKKLAGKIEGVSGEVLEKEISFCSKMNALQIVLQERISSSDSSEILASFNFEIARKLITPVSALYSHSQDMVRGFKHAVSGNYAQMVLLYISLYCFS